ncbi:diguanylate cyclase domain-containing protein [Micromonosporaceae bacterium Da 78-11]
MRWPQATTPAWPVHVGYAVVTAVAGFAYAFADPGTRVVIFALATAVPILTFFAALASGHLTDRRPWLTAVAGLLLLALSMGRWPDWITEHHLGRAEGRPVDFIIATAHLPFLLGTGWALQRHGKNDPGGTLDSALFGLCAAGPLWAWLFSPRLTADATLLGQMLALADLMVLCAVIATLTRIGAKAKRARGPIGYLVLCTSLTLAGEMSATLTLHGTATWTNELMMLAYLAIAAAPLHPAAPHITFPGARLKAATGEPPLAWIGAALSANPLMAAVQAVNGDTEASLLLPVGSLLVVPLVLLRLKQLSTQRGLAERTLAHHAHHDELTGLLNRRRMTADIDQALAELGAGDLEQVTVLLCDLDGFKPVNDRFGHQAGDAVLKTVAVRLTGAVDRADVVGRIGGDEFLVLIKGREPGGIVERISELLREPIPLGGTTVQVGVSVGVATARRGAQLDRDNFIGLADTEMYAVKATRRQAKAPRAVPQGREQAPTYPVNVG